jgi:predicted transcriptional regulator of viral defense system
MKFLGWIREPIGESAFRISDREKTVIDALDLPQHSGGTTEVAKSLSENLDWVKLGDYAKKIGNGAVCKRLGYLLEALSLGEHTRLIDQMQGEMSNGYSWLDPTAPKKVYTVSKRWRLYVNLPNEALKRREQ